MQPLDILNLSPFKFPLPRYMTKESVSTFKSLVAQAGKGAVMMKRDLKIKSAFRHVHIAPCDPWLLLSEWQGKFYVDMFLPFGLRTTPRILFAKALHWRFETLEEGNVTLPR
jgi:hypothetical protein